MNNTILFYVLIGLIVVGLILLVIRYRQYLLPRSLSNRLPLAFLGVAAVSVVVMIAVLALQIQNTLEIQKGKDFLAQAELSASRLAEQIDNQISSLENMRDSYSVSNQIFFAQRPLDDMSPSERNAYIQQREAEWTNPDEAFLRRSIFFNPVSIELNSVAGNNLPLFSQILVTDQYGSLAGTVGEEPENYYYGDEAWWQTAWNSEQENALFVGQPYLAEDGETVLIDLVMPLPKFDRDSDVLEYQGVLRAKLRLSEFALFTEGGLGENIELALLDKINGEWLFSSKDPQKVGTVVSEDIQENIDQFPLNWGVDPDETGEDFIHSHSVLSSSPEQPYLDDLGLTIVLQQPARGATDLSDFILPVFLGAGIALLLAGLIGYFIARQISQPITSLTDVAVSMADGELSQQAPEDGPSELRALAGSFNRMTGRLREILFGLEQQVEARTNRLEIVASLGERLSSILRLEDLLPEVVNQIQDKFGYYHAHIYLLDDDNENLIVAAGTGQAGVEMKAQGHSIPLDALTSLVARAARSSGIVRVDNVRETPDWLPNLLLPDTFSEMAVPISYEGKVMGVLDVQQDEIAGLDEGDAALLRSLANHVAVATNNARLFEQVETALAEARAVQRRYIEQSWDRASVARRGAGWVQFSMGESTTFSDAVLAEIREQSLAQHEPVVITVNEHDDTPEETQDIADTSTTHHVLVAPIELGDVNIGNLQLHQDDAQRNWTENDLALISAVIDQVAQTAENLRLLDETQERASRERLITQISDKLRRAPDIETLMKSAVSELSRALNPERTFVRFDTDKKPQLAAANGDGKDEEVEITEAGASINVDETEEVMVLVSDEIDVPVEDDEPEIEIESEPEVETEPEAETEPEPEIETEIENEPRG